MRDTEYATEIATSIWKFPAGDEARIERLLTKSTGQKEIRLSRWKDGREMSTVPAERDKNLVRSAVRRCRATMLIERFRMKPPRYLAFVVGLLLSACGGGDSTPTPTAPSPGITVTPGTWTYTISADVPLFNSPGPESCTARSSGTTVVSSSGALSIPFSGVTCNSCSMSGRSREPSFRPAFRAA